MKRSVGNSDLAGSQGPTKARKSLDLGREDQAGDCNVDSASGLDREKEDPAEDKFERYPVEKTPGEAAEQSRKI